MTTTLLQLAKLISDSIADIETKCAEAGTSVPELDVPFDPSSEAFRLRPGVAEAVKIATSAAYQLIATLRPAPISGLQMAGGFYQSAVLRVAFESNVARIIKEGGGEGMHVDDIAGKAKVDSKKLVRILRFLATYHVFREVEPDVFANNRLSSVLDLGKPLSEIQADPINKFEGTHGMPALLGHMMDESAKSAAYLWETMEDPKTASSEEPEDAPLSKAIGRRVAFWEWIEEPEQAKHLASFGVAMRAWQSTLPADAMLRGFDWKSLTENDLLVDVAGGIGNAVLPIARANPSVKILIQDRPAVIEDGERYWKHEYPEALESGRVKLEARDLFGEQPIKTASVFLLRRILHDWSDKYASKILTTLRAAATPHTRLVIIDSIMHHVCHDPPLARPGTVAGWDGVREDAPAPLLPNFGIGSASTYGSDIHMFVMHNAQERTLSHLSKLLAGAGWRLVRVYPDSTNIMPQVEAVPI